MFKRKILIFLIIIFTFAIFGCKDDVPPITTPVKTVDFEVYRTDKNAEWLIVEKHTKEVSSEEELLRVALETLLNEQPLDKELVNVFPSGVKVLSLDLKDELLTIDLSKEIIEDNIGGSSTELFIVESIVNTATQFPNIKKVKIIVEGKEVETLTGHMDLREPFERDESIIKKSV